MPNVVDNGMVAHLWAHHEQQSARSHNGNFWFDGDTIYSYSTPLARIVIGNAGQSVALRTTERFSITTSGKHEPAISRAIGYGDRAVMDSFTVPSIGAAGGRLSGSTTPDHAANLAHLVDAYANQKARFVAGKQAYLDVPGTLARMEGEALDYASAFGLAAPAFDVAADVAEIREASAARNTPEAIAKREKAAAKRRERQAAREAQEAATWQSGQGYFRGMTPAGGAYLRVRNGNLETSLGASVPLDHAVKAFRFVKLCRERGEAWHRNGHSLRVGHFQVDSIAANGDFRAGCHFIEWSECERVAKALGVFEQEASADAITPSQHAA